MEPLQHAVTERRRKTRNSIYGFLYYAQIPKSKQEIATALSLSLPTVHQNVGELLDAGLLRPAGIQQSTGGRRATSLTVMETARFAVGVSIAQNRFRILATDLKQQEIAYKKTNCFTSEKIDDIGDLLARELEAFLDDNRLNREQLLGVGIAVPAVLDADRQVLRLSPTMHLRNESLSRLTGCLPYPSFIENDGTSGGYAEWFAQTGQQNMAYVSLENGVGGAVLCGAQPYPGDNCRSGEFGHMCVEPDGLPCKCGKRGCLEVYCSAERFSNELGITLEAFFERLGQGDAQCAALWDDALRHLAIGVNNIRMMLDCDVVLGGFLTPFLEPYLPQLREKIAALNTFEADASYLKLCRYPHRAIPLGVALHFIKQFIEAI